MEKTHLSMTTRLRERPNIFHKTPKIKNKNDQKCPKSPDERAKKAAEMAKKAEAKRRQEAEEAE
jgi:hypothetical protein